MPQKREGFYEFGPFAVDAKAFELTCGGIEIRLEPKAFDLLVLFLSNSGQIVSREQIELAIWPGVSVGKNNIDRKISDIRKVLLRHDPSCRYIETVPKRGWRFTDGVTDGNATPSSVDLSAEAEALPINPIPGADASSAAAVPWTEKTLGADSSKPIAPQQIPTAAALRFFALTATPRLVGIVLLVLAAIGMVLLLRHSLANFEPHVVAYRRLTTDGLPKIGPLATDGSYVYFGERAGGTVDALASRAAVPTGGGDVVLRADPVRWPSVVLNVAQNTRDILYGGLYGGGGTGAFSAVFVWRQKQRVLEALAQPSAQLSPRISPDGRSIAYYAGLEGNASIIIRDLAGPPNIRRIPVRGMPTTPAWSPDGARLRFSIFDPVAMTVAFSEVRRDGSDLHRLPLASRPQTLGGDGCWTGDQRYFIFSELSAVSSTLWIRREGGALGPGRSVQLTNGPVSFDLPAAATRGNTVFARGSLSKNQLDRYDARRGQFTAFWEGVAAVDVSFSNDGMWAAYRNPTDDTLWVGRSDGSERQQLTQAPLRAYQPHWSPDGGQIAFMGQAQNQRSKIFIIDASGGHLQTAGPDDSQEQGVPSWSRDGRYLVFGELRQRRSDGEMEIRVLDLKTGKETILPGSRGKWTPRWSPDGRFILALATDFSSLALFDCARKRWMPLATGRYIDDPAWSLDSRFVHFSAETAPGSIRALFRVRIADATVERLAPYPASQFRWSGVGPDGSPLALNSTRIEDIYAIDFK